MEFQVISRDEQVSTSKRKRAFLRIDQWNDYFIFVTMFRLFVRDENGHSIDIGDVKIGFKGQSSDNPKTHTHLQKEFIELSDEYFSLGQDVSYYRNLSNLSTEDRNSILRALNDIVHFPEIIPAIQEEEVFGKSLLRDLSLSLLKGQYRRVLDGLPPLTDFKFAYSRQENALLTGINLHFKVKENSTPSTNIHAVIGRNGVGKTTLLNGIIEAALNSNTASGKLIDLDSWDQQNPIADDYFSSLVSVSFSAFDPFTPPKEQPDPSKGTCYFYIGLKNQKDSESDSLKKISDLRQEFITALLECHNNKNKKNRWLLAIQTLESDSNFKEMKLQELKDYSDIELQEKAKARITTMSSGHTIALLTITKLVATVEEKTLVLIDEPESHLHPPLLSAFIRALSDLLHDRNGVAVIATHSPVVLQEVPSSCVWIIDRIQQGISIERPPIESFGENVGILTREVFGLEVTKSGFHKLLSESILDGKSYEEIVDIYKEQLGYEARAILKSLILRRDKELSK